MRTFPHRYHRRNHFRYAPLHTSRKRDVHTLTYTKAHANLFINPVLIFCAFLPLASGQNLILNTERVFNTLTLVAIVSEPLQNLLQSLPQLVMALGCFDRIQAYLLAADHEIERTSSSCSEIPAREKSTSTSSDYAYSIDDGHFAWAPDKPAILHNLNIDIPTGKLTIVVGSVGSGKTSLLHALLGECFFVQGFIVRSSASVAFCAQQPWLPNSTVRSTIIGPSEYDSAWYDEVIQICALRSDIKKMPHGDGTTVGSGGAALSGGQKQRIVCLTFSPPHSMVKTQCADYQYTRLWRGQSMPACQ